MSSTTYRIGDWVRILRGTYEGVQGKVIGTSWAYPGQYVVQVGDTPMIYSTADIQPLHAELAMQEDA